MVCLWLAGCGAAYCLIFRRNFQRETNLSLNGTNGAIWLVENTLKSLAWVGPPDASRDAMKVAAKQNGKSLDDFTCTILPCRMFRAVAALTIKHIVLLVGFGVGMMALVRLILAD